MTAKARAPALLVLENGSLFRGVSIGVEGQSVGEVVFNTSLTGYQEILTDPSYAEQIVTLTCPHIGNVGVTDEDEERDRIWAKGLVVRDSSLVASNFRSQGCLSDYLNHHQMVGIAEIDTRRLTRILRDQGAQNGVIYAGSAVSDFSNSQASQLMTEFGGLKGMDLAQVVTTKERFTWSEGSWSLGLGYRAPSVQKYRVVAYDFGAKNNILRMLVDRGCSITVVPATTAADEVLAMKPDGVFLSNGPGDPGPCDYAIAAVKKIISHDIPVFGICLGHQILALASDAATVKMKFGHHGANHPVQDLERGTVMITSQNHGFAVDSTHVPDNLKVTHRSLFDQSIQGIHRTDKPAFGFQGHPEASPGPHDAAELFDHFIELMEARIA